MCVMVCLPSVRGGTRMPGRNGVATPSAKKASRNYSHTHIRVIHIHTYMCVMVCLPSVRGGTRMPGRNEGATPSAKKASSNYSHTYISVLNIRMYVYK